MEIIYVSNDEVHQSLAEELAIRYGVTITGCRLGDALPDSRRFDAVVYDFDAVEHCHWPMLLARIMREERTCPMAIHSYLISDKQAATLQRHGIAAEQRLCASMFCDLCRAARKRLTTLPAALKEPSRIELDA